MKKKLLSMFVAAFSLSAAAQTTMGTANELKEGANSFEYTAGSSVTAYWKYTTTAPTMLTINPNDNCNAFVKGTVLNAETGKADTITLKSAEYGYPKTAYGLPANTTVYVGVGGSSWSASSITVGCTAEMISDVQGIGKGLTAEDAMDIKLGTTQIIGTPFVQGYDQQTYYATYTPSLGGVLVLTAGAYVSGCTVNGVSTPFNYDSASKHYILKTKVSRGETYQFVITNYNPVVFSSELTFPQPGSVDMPFDLKDGDNTLPAASGKYYYTFVAQQPGYARITAEGNLPEGQVKMYDNPSSLQYDSPTASSAVGSLNLRFEVTKPANTYYVVVNKVHATESDETFHFAASPYQTGDQESDPIVINSLPAKDLTIQEVGTYYYAVDIPAAQRSFLVVEANEQPVSAYTGLSVYPVGQSYLGEYGQQKVRVVADGDTDGVRYILKWTSKEDKPLVFNVYTQEIQPGDLASDPIAAVLGENKLASDGTVYYSYTATKSGKLVVTAAEGQTVSFPRGAGKNDGKYNAIVDGQKYTLDVTAAKPYIIQIDGATTGSVFTLAEEEYVAGDARTCPLDIEGVYDFSGKKASNVWVRYTAAKAGILTIKCNAPYASTEKVQYCRDEETAYPVAMVKSEYVDGSTITTYEASTAVAEGEAWLVNIQFTQVYDNVQLTFEVRDALPGETIDSPIVLENGKTYDIPKGTYDSPVWAMISVTEGSFSLKADDYIGGYIYTNKADAKADVRGRYLSFSSWDNGEYLGYYLYTQTIAAGEEGDYYLKLTGNYSTIKMSVEGTGIATAISNATAKENAPVDAVYTLSGAAVSGHFSTLSDVNRLSKGIYLVKQGNHVHKLIVK